MKLNITPKFLLVFLFLISLLLAIFFMYKLSKTGQVGFLVRDRISVFSDISEIKAEFRNKAGLEDLLDRLGFWRGVTPDNWQGSRNDFKPKKLIIHITNNEFSDTRLVDKDGKYLLSARTEGSEDGVFQLYLGFNKDLFENQNGDFGGFADYIIIVALYDRTRVLKGSIDQNLIDLRDSQHEKEPFIKLTKD